MSLKVRVAGFNIFIEVDFGRPFSGSGSSGGSRRILGGWGRGDPTCCNGVVHADNSRRNTKIPNLCKGRRQLFAKFRIPSNGIVFLLFQLPGNSIRSSLLDQDKLASPLPALQFDILNLLLTRSICVSFSEPITRRPADESEKQKPQNRI